MACYPNVSHLVALSVIKSAVASVAVNQKMQALLVIARDSFIS